MKNNNDLELMQSNYIDNYNAIQLSLPVNLGLIIDPNDKVVSFLKALEGVNLGKYFLKMEKRGRKGHDKVALLEAALFGNMIGIRSSRALEDACRNDIRFLYLTKEERPSFMAFERLFNDYLVDSIDSIFFDITQELCRKMDVNPDECLIDGTKLEANANKNLYVSKKRTITYRSRMYDRITDSIEGLNGETNFNFPTGDAYCAQEIGYIVQYLMETMVNADIEIVYGRGKRKSPLQRWYDRFIEYYARLLGYEYWLNKIGDSRNSCSKTDEAATMMRTKWDYYNKTGVSRACYNAQIGVSGALIVNADLYQNSTDVPTFISFIERYREYTGRYPESAMADAGYGSYDNYMFCAQHGINMYMKYNMYPKLHSESYKKNIYSIYNWETDEKGSRICPNGHVFDQYIGDRTRKGKYLSISQQYTSSEKCEGCPFIDKCAPNRNKDKVFQKVLSRNVVLNEFHDKVDENLETEHGKELEKKRRSDVEGAIGVIKQDMKFTRFTRRGMKNTKMEFLMVCLGYDFNKYHTYLTEKREKDSQKAAVN